MSRIPGGMVRIADVARDVGLSPTRIRQLADSGVIPSIRSEGGHRLFELPAVRAALARRTLAAGAKSPDVSLGAPVWQRELGAFGLAEHEVWRRIQADLSLDQSSKAGQIVAYAFMEMLNNAIDHSRSDVIIVRWWVSPEVLAFEISDSGIGAFANLKVGLGLSSDFESVQELTKGKRTTDPANHTGEGIFFTSKAVDLFRLTSDGVRWTVDNLRDDSALGLTVSSPGTTVFCQIDPNVDRELAGIFRQFSRDHAFIRTRPTVKLFGLGLMFVSRSEARRLLDGLDADFEEIEVDFAGVEDVGQGFIDELLRVWPSTHSGKKVLPINMNSAVEFMVKRGLGRIGDAR